VKSKYDSMATLSVSSKIQTTFKELTWLQVFTYTQRDDKHYTWSISSTLT